MNNGPWTAPRIRALKGSDPFACVTAYDSVSGAVADEAGIPLILVGDSLAMTVLGHETTLTVTLDEMLHHTRAVARAVRHALVVTDLPFLTYHVSIAQAVESAGRALQAGASAVKLEGGRIRAATIRALIENGIPVMGHIGLLPQHVRAMGGYRVQGRTQVEVEHLLDDAVALEEAGCFSIVIEGVPSDVARRVTEAVRVPTVGIGAGAACDGQILVLNDLLGLTRGPVPRFVRPYAALGEAMRDALVRYRQDVERRSFPGPEHTYDA